jgi:3-deoxy-manno-octulosonate cytidylyltransferase (CMP-KDO synthetase)
LKKIVIIPARMASTRLPGKPMLMAGGKPLVHWTYEQAKKTEADQVIVATPDKKIADYCLLHGLVYWPTPDDLPTGTHRCAFVAKELQSTMDDFVVIDMQVEYPLVSPEDVNRLWSPSPLEINTLVEVPVNATDEFDRNIVKTVISEIYKKCFWFSRAPMVGSLFHVGIYSYTMRTLLSLGQMPQTRLSKAESLEQLAWIEHGYSVIPFVMDSSTVSIDCPDDWQKFLAMVESKND